jgi:hypothetical protein
MWATECLTPRDRRVSNVPIALASENIRGVTNYGLWGYPVEKNLSLMDVRAEALFAGDLQPAPTCRLVRRAIEFASATRFMRER